jgi:hypothetical protein
LARGDHIWVRRLGGLYSHHGIDCGDGSVIHYSGDDWRSSRVRQTDSEDFRLGGTVHVRSYEEFYRVASLEDLIVGRASTRIQRLLDGLRGISFDDVDPSPEAVVRRARSRIGDGGFDFVFNNCEHFATWCKTGLSKSAQVEAIWKFALNPGRYARLRVSSLLTARFDRSSKPTRLT